jgi:Raf kinase inhibitor-like YbhB/YbcL family protein
VENALPLQLRICITGLAELDVYTGGIMNIKTNAFQVSEAIPEKYTCDGADVSPHLKWDGAPDNTRSFALICDDPDAPRGTFTHWILYGLAFDATELPENLLKKEEVDSPKCKQGTNDFGKIGYGGPCPPRGPAHRYYFKLYALDTEIHLSSKSRKQDLESAMKDHILAKAELMGTYQRK